MFTLDQATIDSAGAFFIGQLEKYDPTMHEPLQEFTYTRDIDMRVDAFLGDEFTSFSNLSYATTGGINPSGKSWISDDSTTLPGIGIDLQKTQNPLHLWGQEVAYTVPELAKAQRTGMDLDGTKVAAMRRKWNQDADQQMYGGDPTAAGGAFGDTGLLNNASVPTSLTAAAVGTGNSTLFNQKTPTQILADVNNLSMAVYIASGYTIYPRKIGMSPLALSYLNSQLISSAGNQSILAFLRANSMALAINGVEQEFVPMKYCVGTNNGNPFGVNATDMMIAYTQDYERVRFPMVPFQGLPMQYVGISYKRPYIGKLGVIEVVYPETIGYMNGIN